MQGASETSAPQARVEGLVVILAIDPGVRGCGVALFRPLNSPVAPGRLHTAAYVKGSKDAERAASWREMARAVDRWSEDKLVYNGATEVTQIVVELPRVYQGSKQKGDPNDLIELAAVVGALCMWIGGADGVDEVPARVYYPYEWKGMVPKQIHHERAKARLDAAEMAAVELPSAKSLQHNVWDAVALALHHCRRL